MVAPLTIGGGITIEGGISVGHQPVLATLKLALDASTYTNTTSGPQQNVSGTSDNTGFFPYGWPAYSAIQPGWTCVETGAVVTVVDGVGYTITTVGTPFTSGSTYTFTGANSWIDSVSGRTFILNNGVTYSTDGGGSLVFDAASAQNAECASSLSNLSTWTVEAWHYYTGTNTGSFPCIVVETYTGGQINYVLGYPTNSGYLQTGFFDGAWEVNPTNYSLIPGDWYQLVGIYDGTTIKLYVNNLLVSSSTYSGTPISSGAGIRLMERWDTSDYWGGSFAIVKIYEGDIGQSGVTSSWNAHKSRFGLTSSSFTVNSSDISSPGLYYGGYSSYSTTGFTSNGTQLYNGISYTISSALQTQIMNTFANAGLDFRYSYVWQVSWNTGGTCLVRLGFDGAGLDTIVIAPIDQTDTRWQSGNTNGPTLTGTFTFPATFTPYSPPTTMNNNTDWC